jgi:hypothetical protein
MAAPRDLLGGVVAGTVAVAVMETLPDGGLTALVGMAVVPLTGFMLGLRMPLWLRVACTIATFYFGASLALVGRTTAPGLSWETGSQAAGFAVAFAGLAAASLLAMWPRRIGTALLAAWLPVCLAVAFGLAAMEEAAFVRAHRAAGCGPTARRTVSMHWLAYDAAKGELYGSD